MTPNVSGDPRVVVWAWRLYRLLTRVYPREFRVSYSQKLEQAFLALCRDACRSGTLDLMQLWVHTLWDLFRSAYRQHTEILGGGDSGFPHGLSWIDSRHLGRIRLRPHRSHHGNRSTDFLLPRVGRPGGLHRVLRRIRLQHWLPLETRLDLGQGRSLFGRNRGSVRVDQLGDGRHLGQANLGHLVDLGRAPATAVGALGQLSSVTCCWEPTSPIRGRGLPYRLRSESWLSSTFRSTTWPYDGGEPSILRPSLPAVRTCPGPRTCSSPSS